MKEEGKPKVKVIKVAPRRFRIVGQYEGGEDVTELVAPAEYDVRKEGETLARIVKMGDGWRVCEPTERSKIGTAVSPIGLNRFRQVKAWALETFA